MEPIPLHWELGILATGLPGKPLGSLFLIQRIALNSVTWWCASDSVAASPPFWARAPEVATKAFFQAHSQPLFLLTLSHLAAGLELKLEAASHTLEKRGFIPQGWTRKSMRPPFPATP